MWPGTLMVQTPGASQCTWTLRHLGPVAELGQRRMATGNSHCRRILQVLQLLWWSWPRFCDRFLSGFELFIWGVAIGSNSHSLHFSLCFLQVVHAQSVVLEWRLYQNQLDARTHLSHWTSAFVHIDNPQISYTAEVTPPIVLSSQNVGMYLNF